MSDSPAGGRRIVAIGGGRGSSQVILAAAPHFAGRTVVVAVTDTGRSTGVARSLGGIPAPGDLRNTLATLAREPDGLAARLLQHRFRSAEHPALDGMALGNLVLAALTELTGDLAAAADVLAGLLAPIARVLPASSASVQLCAELADGSLRRGELAVRGPGKPPIRRLFLDPPAPAAPAAVEAIMAADLVVLGPGSFYTSLLATLLFEGLVEALARTAARVVFVANTTTQPGQTDGMGLAEHVAALVGLLGPGVLDAALVNVSPGLDEAVLAAYAAEGLHVIGAGEAELGAVAGLGVTPVVGDFAERAGPRALWNKQDTVRHDPERLGAALAALAGATGTSRP